MKLYQVSFETESNGHAGYAWYASRKAASAAVAKFRRENAGDLVDCDITKVEAPLTKAVVLSILNRYASHPDNG